MLEYTFRPLSQWPQEPTPSYKRKKAPFRAVDRYGVTEHNEQYKGWTGLPDKRDSRPDRNVAAALICRMARDVLNRPISIECALNGDELCDEIIRGLKMKLHPDRRGSDVEFKELQQALEALGK